MMPQTGFLVNQLVCMLTYQVDRLRRGLLIKEKENDDQVKR